MLDGNELADDWMVEEARHFDLRDKVRQILQRTLSSLHPPTSPHGNAGKARKHLQFDVIE